MVKAKELFLSTRPWSFPMTIISITIGTVLAFLDGFGFNINLYLLVLLGSVILHAFTNVINDYFDYKYGVDKNGAPTTKYRPHPIVAGFLSPRDTLIFAIILLSIGTTIGLYLTYLRGIMVLLIGGSGVLLASLYTAPPLKFKYRALGEMGIFFAFGPIMVLGAYYVQAVRLSFNVFLAAVPIGILIALVAFANNLRDIEYDTAVGIKTLPAILGVEKGIKFFFAMNIFAIILVLVLIVLDILPFLSSLSLFALFNVVKLVKRYRNGVPENADPLAAQTVILFGLLFIIGLISSNIFSAELKI